MAQSNVEIVKGMYDAFAKGDVPGVLEVLSPDVVWTEFDAPGSPVGGVHVGPEAVVNGVFMPLLQHFDEVAVMPDEVVEAGSDKVLALGHFKAKSKATGKSFNTRFAHVVTFSGGMVAKFDVYEDSGTLISSMS